MSSILFYIVIFLSCGATKQLDVDGESASHYVPAPHYDAAIEQLLEQNSRRDGPLQPVINVQEELNKLSFCHSWNSTWPASGRKLGTVSAVSFDNANNVLVFHRGDHVWESGTYDGHNRYRLRDQGPIADNTIVAFDRSTGAVTYEWGKDLFYMPHGLTVDHNDNVWITDVGLHQVMRFGENRFKPDLILGTAFEPGNSQKKFCKPTAVAVHVNDDFFVADGYCNSRIIKFSKSGEWLLSWGHNSFQGYAYTHTPENFFAIPHALTLAKDLNLLCVADRENGRVQCFNTMDGTFHSQYHSPVIGDRWFSVAYAPINGGQLFVVNGPDNPERNHKVFGFVIDMQTREVISKFGPDQKPFENPHDIIVTPDGREVYVAQLSPKIVFKFVRNETISSSTLKPPNNTQSNMTFNGKIENVTPINDQVNALKSSTPLSKYTEGSRRVLIIVSALVCLTCVILFTVWMISRHRRSAKTNNTQHNDVEYNKLLSQC